VPLGLNSTAPQVGCNGVYQVAEVGHKHAAQALCEAQHSCEQRHLSAQGLGICTNTLALDDTSDSGFLKALVTHQQKSEAKGFVAHSTCEFLVAGQSA